MLGRQDLDAHCHGDVVGRQRRRGRALVHCPSFAAYGRAPMSGLSSGDPDDPAVTGDDAADPVPGVSPARDEDVAVDELREQTTTRLGAHVRISVGHVHPVGLVEQRRCTAESATRSAVSPSDSRRSAMCPWVVAGRRKRRDPRSELHVARDGLEAVEERLSQRRMCGRFACVPTTRRASACTAYSIGERRRCPRGSCSSPGDRCAGA